MTEHKRDIYDILGVVAMILTPTAAAVFFGWRVWSEVLTVTGSMALAGVAAVATAVSLEIVGIYAGHVAITFYRQGDKLRGTIAGIAMLAYVGIGVWELQGTIGAVVFLIAPLVYLLVALRHDARAVQTEQRETAQDDKAWERQQIVEDKKRAHELKLEKIRGKQAAATLPPPVQRQLASDIPSDWRSLTPEQKRQLEGMPPSALEEIAPISRRTAERWASKLSQNGHQK